MHREKSIRLSVLIAATLLFLTLVPSSFAEIRTTKFAVAGLS